jgi:hypothetical protein
MSEKDHLKALCYDIEDELTCLEAELQIAERDDNEDSISEIEGEIDCVLYELDAVHEDLIEWEKTNG